MESQSETTQTVSALKLPVLKTGDYDLWSMRMEQYLTHTDYALWEIIVNGDAPAIASASTEGLIPPKTAKQKLARNNELKAKSTLLLAIPDEHLLKFHVIKDAKTLWETIKTRSEGLDKTYDRFQKLINQLEIHGEVISQEDANLKLLRSLPLAWNSIALIMRNKPDLDTMSMDDLYNNLKVYKAEIKSQSSSSSNSQNMAFVSLENTSSTNEAVNTAHEVSTVNLQGQASSSSYADDVMFSFFVSQSNSQQLDNEDLEQIDTDDLEEMDLKCKGVLVEEEPEKPEKVKKKGSKFDEIQARIDVDHELAHKTLEELQKLYQKEQKWINDFKPMDSEEDESNEEAAAAYEQEKEELRMWLAVVPDEDETVDPEILSVKYPIVDWES
ncbi:hypothetical protein Tco_0899769 [Tanacetum coccineum]